MRDSNYHAHAAAALRLVAPGPAVRHALLHLLAPDGHLPVHLDRNITATLVRDPHLPVEMLREATHPEQLSGHNAYLPYNPHLPVDLLDPVARSLGYDIGTRRATGAGTDSAAAALLWHLDPVEHLAGLLEVAEARHTVAETLTAIMWSRADSAYTERVMAHVLNDLGDHELLCQMWRTVRIRTSPLDLAQFLALAEPRRQQSIAWTLVAEPLGGIDADDLEVFCRWLDETGNAAAPASRTLAFVPAGILLALAASPTAAAAAWVGNLNQMSGVPGPVDVAALDAAVHGTAVEQALAFEGDACVPAVSALTAHQLEWLGNGLHNGPEQTRLPVIELLDHPAAEHLSPGCVTNLLRRGIEFEVSTWLRGKLRSKPTLEVVLDLVDMPGWATDAAQGGRPAIDAWTRGLTYTAARVARANLWQTALDGTTDDPDFARVDPIIDAYGTAALNDPHLHHLALRARTGKRDATTVASSLRRLGDLLTARFGDDPAPWLSMIDVLATGVDVELPQLVDIVAALHHQAA